MRTPSVPVEAEGAEVTKPITTPESQQPQKSKQQTPIQQPSLKFLSNNSNPTTDPTKLLINSPSTQQPTTNQQQDEDEQLQPEDQLLIIDTIDTALIHAPEVELELETQEIGVIKVLCDSGASINVVGESAVSKLITTGQKSIAIYKDRHQRRISTANQPIIVHKYIEISSIQDRCLLKMKFYIIPDIKQSDGTIIDWIIGRGVLKGLAIAKRKRFYAESKAWKEDIKPFIHHRHRSTDLEEDQYWDHLEIFHLNQNRYQDEDDEQQPSMYDKIEDFVHELKLGNITDPAEWHAIRDILLEFKNDVITTKQSKVGLLRGFPPQEAEFQINCWDNRPFAKRAYRTTPEKRKFIRKLVFELCKEKVIRPSKSPYASPVVIREKKTPGEFRMTIDYRLLNMVMIPDKFPLPNMQDMLSTFLGKKWFTSLDCTSAYWSCKVRECDIPKTAFITEEGLYEWLRMPQGPKNSPAHMCRIMMKIFQKHSDFAQVYIDDIIIASRTLQEHKRHVRIVLKELKDHGLHIRAHKCLWFKNELEYLGIKISEQGICPTRKSVDKVLNFRRPRNTKEIMAFLGVVQWLARWIPNLSRDTFEINQLRNSKDVKRVIEWTDKAKKAFANIKRKVKDAKNILAHPNYDKEFVIKCDASGTAIGAVLLQEDEKGNLRPIEFASKQLNKSQRNWHVSEQEIYSCVHFISKWRRYLLPRKFTLYTDHLNLKNLFNRVRDIKNDRLVRWSICLQEYDFIAEHIPGEDNLIADYLSRYVEVDEKNKYNQFIIDGGQASYYNYNYNNEILDIIQNQLVDSGKSYTKESIGKHYQQLQQLKPLSTYLVTSPPPIEPTDEEKLFDEYVHQLLLFNDCEKEYDKLNELRQSEELGFQRETSEALKLIESQEFLLPFITRKVRHEKNIHRRQKFINKLTPPDHKELLQLYVATGRRKVAEKWKNLPKPSRYGPSKTKCTCGIALIKDLRKTYYATEANCDYCDKEIGPDEHLYHCRNTKHKEGRDFCLECIEVKKINPYKHLHDHFGEKRPQYKPKRQYYAEPASQQEKKKWKFNKEIFLDDPNEISDDEIKEVYDEEGIDYKVELQDDKLSPSPNQSNPMDIDNKEDSENKQSDDVDIQMEEDIDLVQPNEDEEKAIEIDDKGQEIINEQPKSKTKSKDKPLNKLIFIKFTSKRLIRKQKKDAVCRVIRLILQSTNEDEKEEYLNDLPKWLRRQISNGNYFIKDDVLYYKEKELSKDELRKRREKSIRRYNKKNKKKKKKRRPPTFIPPYKILPRIVVPSQLKFSLIYNYHRQCHHQGMVRMFYIIRQNYYWRGMRKDINTIVKACPQCQRRKANQYIVDQALNKISPDKAGLTQLFSATRQGITNRVGGRQNRHKK